MRAPQARKHLHVEVHKEVPRVPLPLERVGVDREAPRRTPTPRLLLVQPVQESPPRDPSHKRPLRFRRRRDPPELWRRSRLRRRRLLRRLPCRRSPLEVRRRPQEMRRRRNPRRGRRRQCGSAQRHLEMRRRRTRRRGRPRRTRHLGLRLRPGRPLRAL